MSKGNLTKTIFLACAALGVTAILIASWRVDFSSGGAAGWARPKTYFEQFFTAGGPVVWFVLLPMSVVTVYLATEYFITIRRRRLLPDDISGTIVSAAQQSGLSQLPAQLAGGEDFISVAISRAVAQGGGDLGRMRNLVAESLQEQAMRFLRKIEWVNIIGNVSPMVGLFGTVLGIIKMFNAIAAVSGQPHPSQLAGGISVALVTTFWGLMIAIPALTIHGFFQNRIETLACEAAEESEKLLLQLARMLREQKLVEQQKDIAADYGDSVQAERGASAISFAEAIAGQENLMSFEIPKRYRGTVQSLNVIPFVDILFLLIVFFSLMGQLLETEAPAVSLPDGCDFAVAEDQMGAQVATVTLIRNEQGRSDFAVGAEKVTGADYEEITGRLAGLIDSCLKDLPADKRIVTLRIDKDIPYAEAQYALAAVAKSTATDIRLAAFRTEEQTSAR